MCTQLVVAKGACTEVKCGARSQHALSAWSAHAEGDGVGEGPSALGVIRQQCLSD